MPIVCEDVALLGYGSELVHATLARPATGASRHAVIVLGDAFGLSDQYLDVAQRLAAEGYSALALDIFSRTGPLEARPILDDLPTIAAFLDRLPDPQVLADIESAVAWLKRRRDAAGRVGCIGYSLGGLYAQMAMSSPRGPDAGVALYGRLRYATLSVNKPEHPLDRAVHTRAPLLAMFGGRDTMIPRQHVDALRRVLAQSGQPFEVHVYPQADHAFADATRPEYFDAAAADDAWQRALGWFATHLLLEPRLEARQKRA
jgi:carboxymethylenebutenolidase